MEFKNLLTKYFFQKLPTMSLQDVAIKGLEEGLNSPSLAILAGLAKNETPSVIDYYLEQTLSELNMKKYPTTKEGALEYAVALIDEIVLSQKDIIEGTKEIIDDVLFNFNFDADVKFSVFDGIGFNKAYSLYYTYDDLETSDYNWQAGKTNQELMDEVKRDLLSELLIWKEKIKNYKCV